MMNKIVSYWIQHPTEPRLYLANCSISQMIEKDEFPWSNTSIKFVTTNRENAVTVAEIVGGKVVNSL